MNRRLLVGAAVAVTAAACGQPATPPGRGSGAGGGIAVTGAYVGDDGASSYLPLYLTLHDATGQPDLLEAVIAPQARSATWVVAHAVHTPAEIAAFAEPCGGDPALLADSNRALAAAGDVVVPAHGAVELGPGVGRVQLNGIRHDVRSVAVTLYFASGAEVSVVVPADGPRQVDPLVG